MLAGIQFGKGYPAISVNHCLLVDPSYSFNGPYIVSILGNKIARVFGFYLAMRFLLFFFAFKGNNLCFGKDKAVLSYTGFQCLQALFKNLQIVALPHTSYTGSRNKNALLAQYVTNPRLAIGRKLECHLYDRILDLWIYMIFGDRLPATYFPECLFTTGVIELLDTIKAVPARTHQLTGPGHIV
jgi:hypothetical protein